MMKFSKRNYLHLAAATCLAAIIGVAQPAAAYQPDGPFVSVQRAAAGIGLGSYLSRTMSLTEGENR